MCRADMAEPTNNHVMSSVEFGIFWFLAKWALVSVLSGVLPEYTVQDISVGKSHETIRAVVI